MPTWEATDPKTGKTVEFDWLGGDPPSDQDLDEIFAEAAKMQAPSGGLGSKLWGAYESVMGAPTKLANAAVGAVAPGKTYLDLVKGVVGGTPYGQIGQNMEELLRPAGEAVAEKFPRVGALGRGIKALDESIAGDPTSILPFVGGRKLAMAAAPMVAKGAVDADTELANTIIREGWSPLAVEQLVQAAGQSAFAGLVLKGAQAGKSPAQAVSEAQAAKSDPGAFDLELADAPPAPAFEQAPAAPPTRKVQAYPSVERLKKLQTELEAVKPQEEQLPVGKLKASPRAESAVYRGLMEATGPVPEAAPQPLAKKAPPKAEPSIEDLIAEAEASVTDRTVEGGGSSALSAEELSRVDRGEKYYRVNADGSLSYQGAQPDPAGKLRRGEGVVKILPGREPMVTQASGPDSTILDKFFKSEIGQELRLKTQLEGSLAPEGKLLPASQGRPTKTKNFPEAPPEDPIKDLGGEAGAVTPQLLADTVKGVTKGGTDFLRASVAGQAGVATRNVLSGGRQIIETAALSPLAAMSAKTQAGWLRKKGRVREAAQLDRSAKHFIEVTKAFPKASWDGLWDTFADAWSTVKSKGGKITAAGKLPEQTDLLRKTGNQALAQRLESFSDPSIGSQGKLRKGMMFLSILGDRFVNRTFIGAWSEALRKTAGAKDLADLRARMDADPTLMDFARDTLAEGTGEAFRASWQQMSPEKTHSRSLVNWFESNPLGNVVGLVTQPFARSFVSNMLPNIVEKTPLAFLSKRVRNSFDHSALRAQRIAAKDAIQAAQQAGDEIAEAAARKQLAKAIREQRRLEKDVVYNPHMIVARAGAGALLTTAFTLARLQRGDDGTEFDEVPLGGGRVQSATSSLGEDIPFALAGDIIGHALLGTRKYSGSEGVVKTKYLGQALHGSRYGMPTPGIDLALDLVKSFLGAGDKDEISEDYLRRQFGGVMEGIGRMAGAGAWAGDIARIASEKLDPEEKKTRRTDIGPQGIGQSMMRGAQSQVPGLRKDLPESPRWSKLAPGKREAPIQSLAGAVQTLSPLEKIMRKEGIDPSDVLPRRSEEPKFDMIYLEKFKEEVEGKVLPLVEKNLERVPPEGRETYFVSLMKRAREGARKRAAVEYRRETGKMAPHVVKEREKKLKDRERQRLARPGAVSSRP